MDLELNATLVDVEYDSSDEASSEDADTDICIHIIKHLTVADNQSISSGSYYEDIDLLRKNDLNNRSGGLRQLDLQEIIESDSESEDYSELEVLFDENDDDLEDVVETTLEEPELDNEETRMEIIKQIDFFSQFPSFVQQKLFQQLTERRYKIGDIIIKEGDKGDGMYVILSGTAKVWINKDNKHITNLYSKMYFGERALLYAAKRCANVTAIEDTECLFLSKEAFRDIQEVRPYLLVRKLPFIQKLSRDKQIAIASKMKTRTFQENEILMEKGTYGYAFFVIMSGVAGIMSSQDEVELRLREGNLLGQKSVLLGHKRNATVKALSTLVCVELQKKHIEEYSDLKDILMADVKRTNVTRTLRQTRRNSANYINSMTSSDLSLDPSRMNSFRRMSSIIVPRSPIKEEKTLKIRRTIDGRKRINNWDLQDKLGKGSFGVVLRCQHIDSKEIATMKIINKKNFGKSNVGRENRSLKDLYKEVEIMSGLFHRNVVQLIALIDDPKADDLIIVMEYCEKRGIFDNADFTPLSESKARKYFRDVLSGLDYLHYHGICHRDIKPMNLFVTAEDVVKIGDFGTACRFQEKATFSLQKLVEVAGTPAFMAPEILVEENSHYHGPAVDLWSSGATLYMFVVGYPPWNCSDEIQLIHNVKFNELKFPDDWASRNLSMTLTHLIQDLLKKSWKERLTLVETMQNDWVTNEQSDPLDIIYSRGQTKQRGRHFSFDIYRTGTKSSLKAMTPRRPVRYNSKRNLLEKAIKTYSQSFCVRVPRGEGLNNPSTPKTLPSHRRGRSEFHNVSENTSKRSDTGYSATSSQSGNGGLSSERTSLRSIKSRLTKSCLSIDLNAIDLEYFDCFLEAIRHTPIRNHYDDDVEFISGHLTENSNVHLMNLYNRRTSFSMNTGSDSRTSSSVIRFNNDDSYSNSFSSLKHERSARYLYQGNYVHSCGLMYATDLSIGRRRAQEDRISVVESFNIPGVVAFFCGVFDGFGGDLVSDIVSRKLPFYIGHRFSEGLDAEEALFDSIVAINKKYLKKAAKSVLKDRVTSKDEYRMKALLRSRKGTTSLISKYETAGSTGAMLLLEKRGDVQLAHIAWLGDSRVLLCEKGVCRQLTKDHKSVCPEETKRIEAAGGCIHRSRLNGNMIVSRGFGALHVVGKGLQGTVSQCQHLLSALEEEESKDEKTYREDITCNGPFCCIPGQLTLTIEPDFEFIVLGSDGLFESATNEEVIEFTRNTLKETKDVGETTKKVVQRFEHSDNISVIVVKLNV